MNKRATIIAYNFVTWIMNKFNYSKSDIAEVLIFDIGLKQDELDTVFDMMKEGGN